MFAGGEKGWGVRREDNASTSVVLWENEGETLLEDQETIVRTVRTGPRRDQEVAVPSRYPGVRRV